MLKISKMMRQSRYMCIVICERRKYCVADSFMSTLSYIRINNPDSAYHKGLRNFSSKFLTVLLLIKLFQTKIC